MDKDRKISTFAIRNWLSSLLLAVQGDWDKYEEARTKIKKDADDDLEELDPFIEVPQCPLCGAEMRERTGKNGKFYGCSKYPKCKGTWNPLEKLKEGAEEADELPSISLD